MKKNPSECENITDIRTEIDAIDRQIISLIGERYHYVKAAPAFKKNETDVRAPERFAAMLEKRREWAAEDGLDPNVIENIYRDLVNYFIAEELKHWNK